MAFNWNLSRIKNNETLCWGKLRTNGPRTEDGKRTMNPVTNFLIWATIPVGMNEITAKNVEEFIERLEVIKMLDAAEYGVQIGHTDYPDPDAVRAHIGLTTNASRVTKAKWQAKRGEELMRIAKMRTAQARTR